MTNQGQNQISRKALFIMGLAVVLFYAAYFVGQYFFPLHYAASEAVANTSSALPKVWQASHLKTPDPLKGLYLSSWGAGNDKILGNNFDLINKSELNSVVIDIKDYTGKIGFEVDSPELQKLGVVEKRISDIKGLIEKFHDKNIYVIGRIAVFQDPLMVKLHPEWAVRTDSDRNVIWKDYKGISWIDAGANDYWNYILQIIKESYHEGFDEINLDYIRFPSDGNMNDIYYPWSNGREKADVIKDFFAYIWNNTRGSGVILSADLFGMTTTNIGDLNIGQVLENALPYFDYVSPMVYPSHYPSTFLGYKNPADYPYEVVKYSMDKALEKLKVFNDTVASTTPFKLRPWLQDFSLGAIYDAAKVKTQIQAVYDTGLDSWLLWNASNVYTGSALNSATSTN